MLLDFIKRTFFNRTPHLNTEERQKSFDRANSYNLIGDSRTAAKQFQEHLERYPLDVEAMNNLGCCLVDIGDHDQAGSLFERAFSIDDSYLPVIINHAKSLSDKQRIYDGLPYLRQAKAYEPDSPSVNAVYGGMALAKGDAELARSYALQAWLGSFDNLRLANCYLFYCSYTDMDEARLAAEHRFWAETLLKHSQPPDEELDDQCLLPNKKNKIRVAYWSPDFRNHSVRYFALPLIENHDRERFEIVIYHDSPFYDDQTKAIESCCDHFVRVSEIPDARLVKLISSHEIDILVELAGQSSANRLNLLCNRLAARQLTGLGYPPTTGLSSLDGKFLDNHIITSDAPRYYTEPALVLDNSFWCFDPKESPEIAERPPVEKNGYITFACVGNLAKITDRILESWRQILSRVAGSHLIIRSISLNDTAARDYVINRFTEAGIDIRRVEFVGPVGGTDFFSSYNDVDIVLDTYPFNGGTTTCFATYMGVPVVSMAGRSLLSRMGMSVLSNLGLIDWVAQDTEEYVEKAVSHAHDIAFLTWFRAQARSLYSNSALGNGKLFTRDLERHYLTLLEREAPAPHHSVEALPAETLVGRAYEVLRYGQFEAARRIVDHCLAAHPHCGKAHIIWTQRLTENGNYIEAADYLVSKANDFTHDEQFTVWINVARFNILAGRQAQTEEAIRQAAMHITDCVYDVSQLNLLQAYLSAVHDKDDSIAPNPGPSKSGSATNIVVVIVCNDDARFALLRERFSKICEIPSGANVRYLRCGEQNRWQNYQAILSDTSSDVLILMQNNVSVFSKYFFVDALGALDYFDVIGTGGARSWDLIDWRLSAANNKVASLIIPSGEVDGFYEINLAGNIDRRLIGGMQVLDGGFLVIRSSCLRALDRRTLFDPMLEDAGSLLEERFTHSLYLQGCTLAVHINLGLVVDWRVPLVYDHMGEARWHVALEMGFDPFQIRTEDRKSISIPVPSPELAWRCLNGFVHSCSTVRPKIGPT